jgi:hypothetical protein
MVWKAIAVLTTLDIREYVDAATGKRLSQIAEKALSEGLQVDVRRYKAAEWPIFFHVCSPQLSEGLCVQF